MFGYIKGSVEEISGALVVVEVGGIGFQLAMPNTASLTIGKVATISTYMHWNQENGPSLYGFVSALEKTVFTVIISCSGIGPKIGLAVLGTLSPNQFLQAVAQQDIKTLSSVNGIGAKKAEQMLVALRHKVAKLFDSGIVGVQTDGGAAVHWKDLTEALGSLNYSRTEVQHAVHYLREQKIETELSFDQLLRGALSYLAQKR